jgi:hypothetical protein
MTEVPRKQPARQSEAPEQEVLEAKKLLKISPAMIKHRMESRSDMLKSCDDQRQSFLSSTLNRQAEAIQGKRPSVRGGGNRASFRGLTEDLAVWVVFYGPRGGEVPA